MLPDPITTGFYYGIPDADYRKAPGMPQSRLKPILRSPAHFLHELTTPCLRTDFMLCGQVFHHLTLTPDVEPFWVVKPKDHDGRTKDGRAWNEEHKGQDAVSFSDFEDLRNAAESIRENDMAQLALGAGRCEVSAFAPFDLCGLYIPMKARIDFMNDGPSLVDVKLTDDARPEAWSRKIEDMDYHLQAAYYLDLCNVILASAGQPLKTHFVHVVVERSAPYGVRVYDLDEETIGIGRHRYVTALMTYARCVRENYWPSYTRDLASIGVPAFVKRSSIGVRAWGEIPHMPMLTQ